VREYLPFIATENLMMEGVKRGGDRQALHEIIRTCSMAATARMKEGEPCDLLHRLAAEPAFAMTEAEMEAVLDPRLYTGRCAAQVEAFLESAAPLLAEARSQADALVAEARQKAAREGEALAAQAAARMDAAATLIVERIVGAT